MLLGDEGVWLLDWDDVVTGPREQDLLFVLDGGVLAFAPVTAAQTGAFFTGYGTVEIDRHALAYHRSLRALGDLVDFALEVLAPDHQPRARREAAYRYLRGNLVAGGLIEAALGSLHEVGAPASIAVPGRDQVAELGLGVPSEAERTPALPGSAFRS